MLHYRKYETQCFRVWPTLGNKKSGCLGLCCSDLNSSVLILLYIIPKPFRSALISTCINQIMWKTNSWSGIPFISINNNISCKTTLPINPFAFCHRMNTIPPTPQSFSLLLYLGGSHRILFDIHVLDLPVRKMFKALAASGFWSRASVRGCPCGYWWSHMCAWIKLTGTDGKM